MTRPSSPRGGVNLTDNMIISGKYYVIFYNIIVIVVPPINNNYTLISSFCTVFFFQIYIKYLNFQCININYGLGLASQIVCFFNARRKRILPSALFSCYYFIKYQISEDIFFVNQTRPENHQIWPDLIAIIRKLPLYQPRILPVTTGLSSEVSEKRNIKVQAGL